MHVRTDLEVRAVPTRGTGLRLVLRGDLDLRAAHTLAEVFLTTGRASEHLVVDVTGVDHAGSAGLRALAREERRRSVRGGSLRVTGAGQPLLRLLAGAGLLQLSRSAQSGRISA
jgi:anti-sigma B factor antagonist